MMQIYRSGCEFEIGFIDFHQKGKCCVQTDSMQLDKLSPKTQTIYWSGVCDMGAHFSALRTISIPRHITSTWWNWIKENDRKAGFMMVPDILNRSDGETSCGRIMNYIRKDGCYSN
jgi:hypothetical protein